MARHDHATQIIQPFNRTKLELKPPIQARRERPKPSFNRTKLELKQAITTATTSQGEPLATKAANLTTRNIAAFNRTKLELKLFVGDDKELRQGGRL